MIVTFLLRRCILAAVAFALFSHLTPIAQAATLVHRYSFESDAADSIGSAHGTLLNGAVISSGAVALNGSGAYVDLPDDPVAGSSAITVETWVTDNGSGNWARVWDFGGGTTTNMFLTLPSGSGTLRAAFTTNSGGGERRIESTRPSAGQPAHIVVTVDGATQTGALYINGALVGSNPAFDITPAAMGALPNVWLGRSQYSADPYFSGAIDEFRIYSGALTAEEVQQNFALGPDVAANDGPVTITMQPQSQTAVELLPATFSVSYDGTRPVNVQWYRGNSAIPGATNDSYTLSAVLMADHNAVFRVALTNTYNSTTFSAVSSNAVLSVSADVTMPLLLSAASLYPTGVNVQFSEGLRLDTATNISNFVITHSGGTLPVTSAHYGANSSNIVLTTAAQSLSTVYLLTVNGVRDLSSSSNRIAADSQTTFTASPYLTLDIGTPAVTGTLTPVVGGFDAIAGGSGIGGSSDQFAFNYKTYSGDFDVQIRLASLQFSGTWARAGLMARDGLTTNAPFAASFATPGPAGCYFAARAAAGGNATMAGSFPVNYPDTWLRLRRTGNVFDGFASLDGQKWQYLGTANVAMSPNIQVGLALTAGNAAGSTAAQFRNDAAGSGAIITNAPLPFEPMGPCSRRTPLVITEIMYNAPSAWGGTNSLEFIELWNSGLITEDLTGHRFTGDISYQFPNGTKIAPGQFLVVARDPAQAQGFYGEAFLGPYTNKLSNGSGTLRLVNELGGRLLEIEYDNQNGWPVAADGTGHSLVLRRPSYGENDPRAWAASDVIGGSPGRVEHWGSEPARGVVINEFLAHTDDPQQDYIEIFNPGLQAVDISGAWLSDEAGTNKFRIPNNTSIAARGFRSWNQTQLGFSLAADGEQIFLVNSNQTRVLDAVNFRGQANGITMGRYPDGAPGFQKLATITEGTPNSAPLLRPLVINEIMYHPISESNEDEFIEIYNRSGSAVDLSNWRIQGGVSFTFPTNAFIAAHAYLVVAENLTNLLARYPQLNGTNTLGNYKGALKNSSDRIALSMPEDLLSTNTQGVVTTNIYYIPVDEVTYLDGGRWGKWSDGGGSSLELRDPDADNRLAANWADSDESAKATWTTIDVTDVLENGQSAATVDEGTTSYGIANRFELFLQGPGEALLDNVEFRNNSGANLVTNGTFEAGATGWTLTGVLRGSFTQSGVGVGNSQALHLLSTDRGDTGPNKIATALSSTATVGAPNTGTLRASVRWQKGSPYVLLRVRGNWMEVSRRLNVPLNCGTPGLPNSRLVANAGPAIVDVSHTPVLPGTNEVVVVTARVQDVDGVGAVTLRYRVDPTANYTSTPMNDNGSGNDAVAGDGIYSGTVPGQTGGALVAFSLQAADALAATSLFPAEAPVRECHVRWGETLIPGSIGTYRLWLTSSNINFWTSREKNANDPFDATFVYGNSRVIYNADTLYSGSPFHAPNYNGPLGFACDYEVNFHPDEKFLGSEPFVLTAYDVVSGNFFFNDDSAQVDLTGTWIARKLGQAYNYRRHVHVVVNGLRRGTIYDDAQQPNSEMLDEYYPNDSERQLRKIESWFEFADNAQSQGSTYTTLERFNKSTGEIDAKRYRWNWRPRSTVNPDDWFAFTNLIAVVNDTASPNYEARVRTWMDVRNFLRPVAVHHICGSWDSYAYQRGKNMYAYKPDGAPWRLMMWDIELALGAGGNSPTDSIYNMFDPVLLNLINNTPAFQREYLGAIQEALDTALAPGTADSLLDERYANFQQNGVPLISPQFIKTWLSQRRTYLLTQIPAASFGVTSPSFQTTANSAVTLVGTAPLTVQTILINGAAYPLQWTSTTTWTVRLALNGGTNVFVFQALDRTGAVLASATNTVNFTGNVVAPEGAVVFNEIMARPTVPGAEFVELFNAHSNYTFSLSGWRVNGLDYTFPAGAVLGPRSFLVLAKDAALFNTTYGGAVTAFAQYEGNLDFEGETLTLLRPGTGTNEIVVDRVRYEAAVPWAGATNGMSLQLVDTAQDNSRVANWQAKPPTTNSTTFTPQWVYVTKTGTLPNTAASFYLYLQSAGEIYVDDVVLVSGSVADSGANLLSNGDFESSLSGTWTLSADFTNSAVSSSVRHSGNSSLRLVATAPGSGQGDSVIHALSPSLLTGSTYTLSFWYLQNSNGTPFVARLSNSGATAGVYVSFDARVAQSATTVVGGATPTSVNSVATNLAAFSPVWLNELQADNVNGPLDNFGQREPWVELHNAGLTAFSLGGCFLSDTYTNLTKWPFPAGLSIPAGGFTLVWCDNQPNQTAAGVPHANFRLASGSGSIALARITNGVPQILDYLNYTNLPSNWSYGNVPDGQPFYRNTMFLATPGTTNTNTSPPLTVFINEWMADNIATRIDPADHQYEDWFELYNPGATTADLGGYYLTDNLTNKFQFLIPNNGLYTIPPGGYLLVWADNEDGQNSTNRADLHANFALGKSGEGIGLFAADGTTIDAVSFGAQTSDVSQGRFPDGAASLYSMPTPTPLAANIVPNTLPVLAVISNRVVMLGQTLSFTASAADNDQPPQALTFSLAGAPFGANIHPLSGLFTWTPFAAPATNTISVIVTDNGTPSLSATQAITVFVTLPPALGGFTVSGSQFSFSWPTLAGQRFQVEYKNDLTDAVWTPASNPLTGTGAPLVFTADLDVPRQFFRLRVLP